MARNKNKLSTKEKLYRGAAVAALGVSALGMSGCSGGEAQQAPSGSETTQVEQAPNNNPPIAEWEGMSDVAKEYRDKTTSVDLYEAAKTPGELEKLFAIPENKVSSPEEYAEVWTVLFAAQMNAGLNVYDFNDIEDKNSEAFSNALREKYAEISDYTGIDLTPTYLSNTHRLYLDMKYASEGHSEGAGKSYQIGEKIDLSTLQTTQNNDGSFTQTFNVIVDDTWDPRLWNLFSGRDRDGLDQTLIITLENVAVNEKGNLVPKALYSGILTERSSVGWVDEEVEE